MVKAVIVLALLGLFAVNSVIAEDELKCYVCDDCEEPKNSITCTEDTIYKPVTTPEPETSTTPDENPSTTQKNDENSSTTQKNDENSSTTQKSDENSSTTQKSDENSSTTQKSDENSSSTQKNDENSSSTQKNDENSSTTQKNDEDGDNPIDVIRRKRFAPRPRVDAFKCFSMTVTDSANKTTTQRGCTKKTCEDIQKDKKLTNCDVCDSENCNPASNIQSWAFTSIALIVVVKMLF